MRKFHCVYTFPVGDFVLEGVFSCIEDARDLAREINPLFKENETYPNPLIILAEMNRYGIIDQLLKEGLQGLYEPIRKLAGFPVKEKDWSDFPHVVCDTKTGEVVGRFNNQAEATKWIERRIYDDTQENTEKA